MQKLLTHSLLAAAFLPFPEVVVNIGVDAVMIFIETMLSA